MEKIVDVERVKQAFHTMLKQQGVYLRLEKTLRNQGFFDLAADSRNKVDGMQAAINTMTTFFPELKEITVNQKK